MKSTTVIVIAPGGLTGETVNQLTNELAQFALEITLTYQGTSTIGNSSLGVMSLGVPENAKIELSVDGTEEQLKQVVASLVAHHFVKTV